MTNAYQVKECKNSRKMGALLTSFNHIYLYGAYSSYLDKSQYGNPNLYMFNHKTGAQII
jgi:hypothetical protein